MSIPKSILEPQIKYLYQLLAEQVTFNEQGMLKGEWDRSVFYDDIKLSRQIIQAQRESL